MHREGFEPSKGEARQIYSLVHLTALPPVRRVVGAFRETRLDVVNRRTETRAALALSGDSTTFGLGWPGFSIRARSPLSWSRGKGNSRSEVYQAYLTLKATTWAR